MAREIRSRSFEDGHPVYLWKADTTCVGEYEENQSDMRSPQQCGDEMQSESSTSGPSWPEPQDCDDSNYRKIQKQCWNNGIFAYCPSNDRTICGGYEKYTDNCYNFEDGVVEDNGICKMKTQKGMNLYKYCPTTAPCSAPTPPTPTPPPGPGPGPGPTPGPGPAPKPIPDLRPRSWTWNVNMTQFCAANSSNTPLILQVWTDDKCTGLPKYSYSVFTHPNECIRSVFDAPWQTNWEAGSQTAFSCVWHDKMMLRRSIYSDTSAGQCTSQLDGGNEDEKPNTCCRPCTSADKACTENTCRA